MATGMNRSAVGFWQRLESRFAALTPRQAYVVRTEGSTVWVRFAGEAATAPASQFPTTVSGLAANTTGWVYPIGGGKGLFVATGVAAGGGASLTPGNPGDIVATSGGVVTNVKPGRIDARVRGLSTASSDNATLLSSLATESGTDGSELWIPEGVYQTGQITAVSNMRINGPGTLRQRAMSPSNQILRMSVGGNLDNMTVEGITFDGNGVSSLARNEYPNLVTNTTFRHCTFLNTGTASDFNLGIAVNQGDNVLIEGNTFDCVVPVRFWNVDSLKIRNNHILGASGGNAIDGYIFGTHTMRGLEISGNSLNNCWRMGVELVKEAGGTGIFDAPIIRDNYIHIADTFDSAAFGISTNYTNSGRITGNTVEWLGTGTPPAYGIEPVRSDYTIVAGNVVRGIQFSYVINKSHYVTIDGNHSYGAYEGIEVVGDNPNVTFPTVTRNVIVNPRDGGIDLKHTAGTDSGGGVYEHNTIIRDVAWAGDSGRAFRGFVFAASPIPNRFAHNTIIQGMTTPTLAVFRGFEASVMPDAAEQSEITNTLFIDKKSTQMIVPLYSVISAAADSVDRSGNKMRVGTGVATDVTTWTT